jgi:serine O-acetyltransferase
MVITRPGPLAVILYRLSHALWQRHLSFLAELVWRVNFGLTGADIHPAARIAGGLRMPHTSGIVIGRDVAIDHNVTLMQGVTLGGSGRQFFDPDFVDGHPRIGDHTWVMAHASILGPISVGPRCMIGAGSVVTKDLPAGTVLSTGRELSDLRKRVESLERRLAETEPTPDRRN